MSSCFFVHSELPRRDFFAVVEGSFPDLTETPKGSYLFLTDDSTDLISQFSTLNFLIHFILHSTDYPTVRFLLLLHSSC